MLVLCFKQKTAYDVRISDWSSDVCSSDLLAIRTGPFGDRFGAVQGGLSLDSFRDKPDGVLIRPAIPRAAEGFATASGKIEIAPPLILPRSDERREGQECVRTYRCRWSPYHQKKK